MLCYGIPELRITGSVMMSIFGAGRLREINNSIGKAISNFRKAVEIKGPIERSFKKNVK